MKAIFLDRDDTLIKDSGYMHKVKDLEFFPDTFEILQKFQAQGYALFIVTNQSGIGRGYFPEADMHVFNKEMLDQLEHNNIKITELVYCPHAPEQECDCRKPKPKLINQLCVKYHIDRTRSYMIGDKDADKEAGDNAEVIGLKIAPGKLSTTLKVIL